MDLTVKEYIDLYNKCPDPNNNAEYHTHYDGEEEDYNKIISYNKQLINKYPFLLPKNRWTGKELEDYNYEYTELDEMAPGWRIAFGEQMCNDIMEEINYSNFENYQIAQIKEKFGSLRWYDEGFTEKGHSIICEYERKSCNICILCGKQATLESKGWISPYCTDCAKEICNASNRVIEDCFIPLEKTK